MGYGRGYLEVAEDEEKMAMLSEQQRAVVEPPYSNRLERPLVTTSTAAKQDGPAHTNPRSEAKKGFDRKLFGTSYF